MFVAGFAARRNLTDPEPPSAMETAFVEATTVGVDPCARRTRYIRPETSVPFTFGQPFFVKLFDPMPRKKYPS